MEKTKKILIGIGTYILFALFFVVISGFLINLTFAAEQVPYLLSSLGEIIVIYFIVSLFFKKKPNSLIPIVIGILGSVLLEIPSLINSISLFNNQLGLATAIVNQPLTMEGLPEGYFTSSYFLSNTTLLSTIYEWILSSEIPAILINGIFLLGYKEASIQNFKWTKKLSHLFIKSIPVFLLILLQFILRILFSEGTSNDYAVINLLVILAGMFIYSIVWLVRRFKKNRVSKLKESI